MAKSQVYGYSDKLSVTAGDSIAFMTSAEGTTKLRAQLVRLIHGDEHPDGPGFIEEAVEATVNGELAARKQYVQCGNFLRVADTKGVLAPLGPFTLHAYIFPTLPEGGRQMILGRWSAGRTIGYGLGINASGRLEFWVGDGSQAAAVAAGPPLVAHIWYFVASTFDPHTGHAVVHQQAVLNRYNSRLSTIVPYDFGSHVSEALDVRIEQAENVPFLIGAAVDHNPARGIFMTQCYNGKIDRSGVIGRVLKASELEAIAAGDRPPAADVLAYWDTSLGYTDRGIGHTVLDTGPHRLHAEGVNCPARGQTGWNWNGRNDCFRLAPEEYGGIEFHDDALTDCDWEPSCRYTIPEQLPSGVYALKVTANEGDGEEHIPFVVRAKRPRAPICLLLPTASYLAYANGQLCFEAAAGQAITAVTPILQPIDVEIYRNGPEFGRSTYDHHADGSGVCYSSYRRPIFNMRPKYRMPGIACPWQFPADLSIVAWLEHMGYDYEVLTDEDLHRDGAAAIRPYRVVMNGSHCEYYSERMLNAIEDYLSGGGRLTYLSGNGYYWVVGFREQQPWIMEVRKLEAGSRAWQARAGEHYLASTGERSGLWRHRNRAPQKLVGVGFTSEGMDISVPYRRMPDSYNGSVAWIFEGVSGEVFGQFGLAGGGAVGLEIDRYDLSLGTPPHTLLLAASEPLTDNYPLVQEDVMFMHPGMGGSQHPLVRADMVYFTTPKGGAVFSASSIAWSSALPWNKFDNSASRVMKNVLDAFAREGPLPGQA